MTQLGTYNLLAVSVPDTGPNPASAPTSRGGRSPVTPESSPNPAAKVETNRKQPGREDA
jgi:hypothetical protein